MPYRLDRSKQFTLCVIRDFKIQRRDGKQERLLKNEFALFHSLSQFSLPTYFVKCRRTFLELNS